MANNENKDILKEPNDTNLKFFTYGIFKPGQLAYSKIKNYVINKQECEINYPMKERDGIPILINEEKNRKAKGYILDFNIKRAYKIISETISKNLYYWDTIKIENEEVNVLFGCKPENGSNPREYMYDFDGKNDPLFKEAIKLIKGNLKLKKDNYYEIDEFFNLQMNYMLLWSAIDRYCKLKYNKSSEHDNRIELSKEEVFQKALKKYGKEKRRPVFSIDKLFKYKFNTEKPDYCINYYYTLRCNVVHRGKTSIDDVHMLKQATKELLNIFEYILNDTFNLKPKINISPRSPKKEKESKNFVKNSQINNYNIYNMNNNF